MKTDGPGFESEGQSVRQKEMHRRGLVLSTVGGAMLVAQFVLLFFIGRDYVPLCRYLGFVLWAAGCVLAWLPVFYFRRKAGVAKGMSYIHTTRLVTTGIYSLVRHPQYLSFFVLAFALALIGQHWLIMLLGAVGSIAFGLGLKGEDDVNIEKFGDDYRRYKEQVPAYNILLGLLRRLRCGRRG
jgi:protein-S-isoprenylcysteine O-methyltransferase Ste14